MGCVKFLSLFVYGITVYGITGYADFTEDAEKTSASKGIAEITLICCHYDLRMVSYPRNPCNPRNPRFRTYAA